MTCVGVWFFFFTKKVTENVSVGVKMCISQESGVSPPGRLFPLLVRVINTSVTVSLLHTPALPLSVVTESSHRCQGLAGVCQNKSTERWPPVKESRAFTSGRDEEKAADSHTHTHFLLSGSLRDWGSLWHRHLRPCHYNLPAGRAESYSSFKYLGWSPDIGLVLKNFGSQADF